MKRLDAVSSLAVCGMTRACVVALAALSLGGCGESTVPAGAPTTRLDAMNVDAIPSAPITGSLAGEEFIVAEARYRVERFPGRERVDLLLSDTPLHRCGLPITREGRVVWLRFDGVTELPTGEARVSADTEDPGFTLHYELPGPEGGHYTGRVGGDAVVSLAEARLGHISGKLFACFGDGQGSCVKGSFEATPCFSRVDGRAIREGVGLEDEALEPQRGEDGEHATTPTAGGGDTEVLREGEPSAPASPTAPEAAQEEVE